MSSLIKKWDASYTTKVNRGDAPYGRDDTIEAVVFNGGADCDEIAERSAHRWIEDGFTDRQERAVKYAVSRLASIHELWDHNRYRAEVRAGYYGEEVRGVSHPEEDKAIERVDECAVWIRQGNIRKVVEQLLEWEYGFVLDPLKKADFSEEFAELSDLHTPNDYYAGKVDPSSYEVSTAWPVGVYLERDVIDGYNRLAKLREREDDHVTSGLKSASPGKGVWIYNFK